MCRSLFLLLPLLGLASSGFAAPLDPLLARPELWTLKQDDFSKLQEARFYRWTSNVQDSARAADHEETIFNLPIVESVARFDSGKLAQITMEIYDRGDAGDLTKVQFDQLLRTTVDALTAATKVKPAERGKDAASAVHAYGLIWQTPASQYLLEYSFTKGFKPQEPPFRAEFVRLTVTPPQRAVSLLVSASSPSQAKFTGLTHVKRDLTSGDVLIPDVPMVDQGQKGYCAVACAERVMRYYGVAADENELAEVANTDTAGGTSAEAMFDALKKLGARLHVRIHPVEEMDVRALMALFAEYNRAARRDSAPPLPDPGHMIDVNGMFRAMNSDVLLDARTKNKADVTRFERGVEDHINVGIPLVWSVMLGKFPEKGIPQDAGGHMRLIIGYNNKTQEILFSDSWGAGHELKRMPLGQAVAMTTGLTTIEPL